LGPMWFIARRRGAGVVMGVPSCRRLPSPLSPHPQPSTLRAGACSNGGGGVPPSSPPVVSKYLKKFVSNEKMKRERKQLTFFCHSHLVPGLPLSSPPPGCHGPLHPHRPIGPVVIWIWFIVLLLSLRVVSLCGSRTLAPPIHPTSSCSR
jgi:hypothetical protein